MGALDCYPKPTRATPDEVEKAIGALARTVKEAPARFATLHDGAAPAGTVTPAPSEPFPWNGKLVAIGADVVSTKPLFDLLGKWPVDGSPIVVVQHMRPELADGMIAKLAAAVGQRVVEATDGLRLDRGMIVFARPGDRHIYVNQWPGGTIRLLDKPPFAAPQPSIALMMPTLGPDRGRADGRRAAGDRRGRRTGCGGAARGTRLCDRARQ